MIVKEQRAQNDQYLRNIDLSYVKLSVTESALEQAGNLATRAYELAIQARSETNAAGRNVLAIEMKGILDSIRDIANSTDPSGRSIFGGFKISSPPFVVDNSGNTSFVGDRGAHTVRISPTMDLQTTIDGSSAFDRVRKSGGFLCLLDAMMIEDLEAGDADLPIDEMKNAASHLLISVPLSGHR